MIRCLMLLAIAFLLLDATSANPVKISDLDREIDKLELEKSRLPVLKPNPLPEGVYSYWMVPWKLKAGHDTHWVQLDLKSDVSPTLIAMVPEFASSGESDGFPPYFSITISSNEDGSDSETICEYREEPYEIDDSYVPIFRNPKNFTGRFLRLTVHVPPHLSGPENRNKLECRLSELMVFRNESNVALGVTVTSSHDELASNPSVPSNLVDGWTQLNLPEDPREKSSCEGYHSFHGGGKKEPSKPYWVAIDLGQEVPIDQINLVPVTPRTFTHRDGYGFPSKFTIEISKSADFVDSTIVLDHSAGGFPYPGSCLYSFSCGGETGRYVKLSVPELFQGLWGSWFFSIAEMEVISNGRNISKSKEILSYKCYEEVHIPDVIEYLSKSGDYQNKGQAEKELMVEAQFRKQFEAGHALWIKYGLVDSFSSKYKLLPVTTWLEKLLYRSFLEKRVHDLKQVRKTLASAQLKQSRQKLYFGLVLMILTVLVLAFYFMHRNRTAQRRIRTQLSQDLHDDLSNDLCSISLLSQMVSTNWDADGSKQLSRVHVLHQVAAKSLDSLRNIVFLTHQDSRPLSKIEKRFEDGARCLLEPFGLDLQFQATYAVSPDVELPGNVIRDVMLVCKEALNNICKHAEASRVEMTVAFSKKRMAVTITDDGLGIDHEPADGDYNLGLTSMRNRIKKHGGKFHIAAEKPVGTTVTFTLPLNP